MERRLSWFHMCFSLKLTLWKLKVAMENGPVEIIDLPIEYGDFNNSYVTVYRRVTTVLLGATRS